MIELFIAIAAWCDVHTGFNAADDITQCRREMIECTTYKAGPFGARYKRHDDVISVCFDERVKP